MDVVVENVCASVAFIEYVNVRVEGGRLGKCKDLKALAPILRKQRNIFCCFSFKGENVHFAASTLTQTDIVCKLVAGVLAAKPLWL